MTYERIFDLKFRNAIPTYELGKRFPKERKKISCIALLDLPVSILKKLIKRENDLGKLLTLRRELFRKAGSRKRKVRR